jgi:uncharacterized protein
MTPPPPSPRPVASRPRSRHFGRRLAVAAVGLGLVLPTLALIPLGSLWLWQKGLLLYWALGACAFSLVTFLALRLVLKPRPLPAPAPAMAAEPSAAADPRWSPAEVAAWARVETLAETADPAALASREGAIALGIRTIEAVARELNPSETEPVWHFTVPEALALIERVAARLRPLVADAVPFGDRLTVGQLISIYHWGSGLGAAGRLGIQAWNIWRGLRSINPATAVLNEAREWASRELYAYGKDRAGRAIARAYVREVGRAAIDLYGGRLSLTESELAGHVTAASNADRAETAASPAEPLRILVSGQTSVGKSSLINALAKETVSAVDVLPTTRTFTSYALKDGALASALLIDSPGLDGAEDTVAALVAKAATADLILWVASGARADRDADAKALLALREAFASRLDRRSPPILLVVTHIDRLRPMKEWAPPYDLAGAGNAKAVSIAASVTAVAADLGFAPGDAVPVALPPELPVYNVDALWSRILAALPEASGARLLRILRDRETGRGWRKVWQQASQGGRVLARTIVKE